VTVTPVVPTIPLVGDTVTLGFTVKPTAVVAEFGVSLPVSVPVIVYVPWAVGGTVNVQLQPPVADTAAGVQLIVELALHVTVTVAAEV
jgi:hypothetical protein